ncbi:MAG TPA: DUF503 domain-containing protein [Candidatus Pseudogracilibacillus intestinigallinarum]|uniref:DUF503 domain-containing protein n=1 Tax=Candidatus Pseudogracilibacillus intestinigallinarum TaxID=2838742 RepID=A0A9D1PPZ8_9BACI|nr:DUF503 domain-containing protein [Candidatus Pseudogracilibacillus intestinigallinarum]
MVVYAEVEYMIYDVQSLKEKRSIVKRITKRVQNEFNVSIAEIEFEDLWQRTKLGIATVSNEYVHAEKVIQQVIRFIDQNPEVERTITNIYPL